MDKLEDVKSLDTFVKKNSWSYTRSKKPIETIKVTPAIVRLTLDIEGISQRQKIEPFSWKQISRNSRYAEKEERVVGHTKGISKYIKSVDFMEEVINNDTSKVVVANLDDDSKRYPLKDKSYDFYTDNDLIAYCKRFSRPPIFTANEYCGFILSNKTVKGIGNETKIKHNYYSLKSVFDLIKSNNIEIGTYKSTIPDNQWFSSDIIDKVKKAGKNVYTLNQSLNVKDNHVYMIRIANSKSKIKNFLCIANTGEDAIEIAKTLCKDKDKSILQGEIVPIKMWKKYIKDCSYINDIFNSTNTALSSFYKLFIALAESFESFPEFTFYTEKEEIKYSGFDTGKYIFKVKVKQR